MGEGGVTITKITEQQQRLRLKDQPVVITLWIDARIGVERLAKSRRRDGGIIVGWMKPV